ncbi:endonuclease [Kribbella jejuensis]|uniref:Endonuclease III n=1 Tax=Kribbella jejuensis TaxID=236068 RepID=A0A542EL80_9ACTN|nr:endonuclease [Kribbella jejuensis]TQJ16107.1 endonuclease III [Kribbella jejuensis]
MPDIVDLIIERHGRTYADEAGITLADKPSPLFQLLVLASLLSARITAGVAVAAARELFAAGYRTPRKMIDAGWQARVDALGRGHYRRYDERTSTMLADAAEHLLDRWNGDLRKLHDEGGDDPDRLRQLLQEFKGIGPSGADIFLREVQAVWPGIAPYVDPRAEQGAHRLGLTKPPRADTPARHASLAAALVRLSRDQKAADDLKRQLAERS